MNANCEKIEGMSADLQRRIQSWRQKAPDVIEPLLEFASNDEIEDFFHATKLNNFSSLTAIALLNKYPAISFDRVLDELYEDIFREPTLEKALSSPHILIHHPDKFVSSPQHTNSIIDPNVSYVSYCVNYPKSRLKTQTRQENIRQVVLMLGKDVSDSFVDLDPDERQANICTRKNTVIVASTWNDIAHPGLAEKMITCDVLIADEVDGPLLRSRPDGALDTSPAVQLIQDVRFRLKKYIEQPTEQINELNQRRAEKAKAAREEILNDIFSLIREKKVYTQKAIVNELKTLGKYSTLSYAAIQGRVTRAIGHGKNKDKYTQVKIDTKYGSQK